MKKVFITWGGWDGHEPEQCAKIMTEVMQADGFDVTLTDSLAPLEDLDAMRQYDLIVPVWTMSSIEGELLNNLLILIKEGIGLAGWHGGMCDAFRQNTDYQYMCGGQWVSHPGGIIDYKVNILDSADPITAGMEDFAMKSEQYYMQVDPGNEVLATTTFGGQHDAWIAGTVMPIAWKRMFGEGKVFYSSLGHVAADFDVPEVKEIMRRGMKWAMR